MDTKCYISTETHRPIQHPRLDVRNGAVCPYFTRKLGAIKIAAHTRDHCDGGHRLEVWYPPLPMLRRAVAHHCSIS